MFIIGRWFTGGFLFDYQCIVFFIETKVEYSRFLMDIWVMRLIITFIIGVLCLCKLQSQDFPIDSLGNITYTNIITIDSMKKDVIFDKVAQWFALTFVSSQNIVQYSDKTVGKIIGKGAVKVSCVNWMDGSNMAAGISKFTIEVSVKDYKYRYVITGLWHDGSSDGVQSPGDLREEKSGFNLIRRYWNDIRNKTHENILLLIESLNKYIKSNETKDDW